MLMRVPLRLRIFLFFGLMAFGAATLVAVAMGFVWARAEPNLPAAPFITAFLIFVFLNTGLALAVWMLFDEHVARPIDKLSTKLRLRAHSGVDAGFDAEFARYLGDLAPAAKALLAQIDSASDSGAAANAEEADRLRKERERLTMLLSEIPIGTILVNPAREIVLYDAQAAALMEGVAPLRLKAPLDEYFDLSSFVKAAALVRETGDNAQFSLPDAHKQREFNVRIRPLGDEGDMVFIETETDLSVERLPRPLVFDFDLLNRRVPTDLESTALVDLSLVVFDTETTGLCVERDAIVQLAAVRVVNGRIVEGEALDSLVDPDCPIPAGATRIHGITNLDVKGAPNIRQVGLAFHHFSRDAVLVAHNAPFDIGLLRKNAHWKGVTWDHPVIDTVLLSAVVFGTTEDHSLDALCERLSVHIPTAQRHSAMGDARATASAVVKLLPLLEGKGIVTFGQLVQETRRHGRLLKDMNGEQAQAGPV